MSEVNRLGLSDHTVITGRSGRRYTLQTSPNGRLLLGQGANGEVYHARSERNEKSVAIKLLAPREALSPSRGRFATPEYRTRRAVILRGQNSN